MCFAIETCYLNGVVYLPISRLKTSTKYVRMID